MAIIEFEIWMYTILREPVQQPLRYHADRVNAT